MEMDWTSIIIAFLGLFAGGGIWGIFRIREEKKKTPYDMLKDLLEEQRRFYEERNAELEREKLDSAEKSSVIMQSHFCQHKYTDPNVVCPVDVANDARLKKRCERCGYNQDAQQGDADAQGGDRGERMRRDRPDRMDDYDNG